MIGKAMNQLPAGESFATVGLLRTSHFMVAGLGRQSGAHTAAAFAAGAMYAMPFWLPEPATLKKLSIQNITVAAAAGNKARLGLARWQNGVAASPSYQGGEVVIDSTGTKTLDCSADGIRLAAGFHAVLLLLQAGITAEFADNSVIAPPWLLSHSTTLGSYATATLVRTSITYGLFPDPLGTWTWSNYPPPPLTYLELAP